MNAPPARRGVRVRKPLWGYVRQGTDDRRRYLMTNRSTVTAPFTMDSDPLMVE